MSEITSVTNSLIKETAKLRQKKYRKLTGQFLIEGYKPIFEAFQENAQIETVFVTEEHVGKFDFVKDKLIQVSKPVMEKISTTESAPEGVAVAKQKVVLIDEIKDKERIVLLENVKDAGNLGTLLRSAAAFGIESVILAGDTIDEYNPKVVRSTVGGLFKIPVVRAPLEKVKQVFSAYNFIATVVNQKNIVDPETIDYSKPFVIMFGSEADGLTDEAISISDVKTKIPISKNTESLNLSVAGSIMFYVSSKTLE